MMGSKKLGDNIQLDIINQRNKVDNKFLHSYIERTTNDYKGRFPPKKGRENQGMTPPPPPPCG